jgi:APA family basic amino acid/polyamine antiporter
VSIGTLLAFAIVCASVLVLRYTDPDRPRPFRPRSYRSCRSPDLACFYLMFGFRWTPGPGSSSGWAGLTIYFLPGAGIQGQLAARR